MRTTQRTMAKTNLMAIWNITHTTRWPVNKAYCRRGTAAILIQGGQSEWSIAVASGPGQDLFPHHHPIIIMLSELSHHLCRRHLRPAHSLNASGRLISCLYAARRIYFVGGKLFRVQGISRKLPFSSSFSSLNNPGYRLTGLIEFPCKVSLFCGLSIDDQELRVHNRRKDISLLKLCVICECQTKIKSPYTALIS